MSAPAVAIAAAHRRAYALSSGDRTYADHVATCAACTAAEAGVSR